MAIEMANRVQDDFSSNALTSFALTRPAGRCRGLRTDDPIFRADLRYRIHTRKGSALIVEFPALFNW
jgi:hypothetical protein